MLSFKVDDKTAEELRDAVKQKYGKNSWGKMKEELQTAIKERAQKLKDNK